MGTAGKSAVRAAGQVLDRRTGYRPTKAEHEQRQSQIHSLLINNLSREAICRFVSEKTTWHLSERSVERLIAKATKLIRASAAFDRDQELGLAILQVKEIYGKTTRIQDYKTALAARKELNELLGLYAPKRLELAPGEGPSSFIAIMPPRPASNQEWEQLCRQQQAAKPPTVIDSTASGGQ